MYFLSLLPFSGVFMAVILHKRNVLVFWVHLLIICNRERNRELGVIIYYYMVHATGRNFPILLSFVLHVQAFFYRTTFGNDQLQLAEYTENDWKFASSKRKCDRSSLEKLLRCKEKMKKKITVFNSPVRKYR